MKRKETTKFLTELLEEKLQGKYYAKEVTLDYGTIHPKRVDVVQFISSGAICSSQIEKGEFICYEVKSCIEDVYSGHGLRFYGERNFIVTTMETYKELQKDLDSGKFYEYLKKNYPESSRKIGFMVPIPYEKDLTNTDEVFEEYKTPSVFTNEKKWKLYIIKPSRTDIRKRSMVEMLFCMLRAKHKQHSTESNKSEWISCSERLPEDETDYLCCYEYTEIGGTHEEEKFKDYGVFYYNGYKWIKYWETINKKNIQVVAWQPLPELYKEEDEECD